MAKTENLYLSVAKGQSIVDALNASSQSFGLVTPYEDKAKAYRSPAAWVNVDTNTNIRPDFTRMDYEYYRPDEAIPVRPKDIMARCNMAYKRNGLIRNIIDLMGDFACQGIKIYHSNPQIQKFYQAWFKRVQGRRITERFLNNLYRLGNVIVKRQTGKLRANLVNEFKSRAQPEFKINLDINVERMEIPYSYTFINPMCVDVINEELCTFVGEYILAIRLDFNLLQAIRHPKPETAHLIEKIPSDIKAQIETGVVDHIVLDPDTICVYHYKKDDWEIWADPIIYSVLKDIIQLEKTKLADIAALDGAISNVRIWKLGDIEHQIVPTPAATARLSNILTNHVGGGTIDIMWGPDLDLVESNSQLYQFLKEEKYAAPLNAIYAAMGIPPTLTGASTQSGFTNNYISLKTLIERLEYGREMVMDFWNHEILLVQKAMGFRKPAQIHFDRMTLSDEAAEKALILQLLDRDVISAESTLERFGEFPELERARLMKEDKQRVSKKLPNKAGAFHNPQTQHEYKKIALQAGHVTPSEIGVELNPRKDGEQSPMDLEKQMMMEQHDMQMKQLDKQHKIQNDKMKNDKQMQKIKLQQIKYKPKSAPGGNGRPKNKKDTVKRKTKVVKPRTSASDDIKQ